MKLSGSNIYITSAFYSFERVVDLVHWTHSFFVSSYYNGSFPFARWDLP